VAATRDYAKPPVVDLDGDIRRFQPCALQAPYEVSHPNP
jgi:hypothetical protein